MPQRSQSGRIARSGIRNHAPVLCAHGQLYLGKIIPAQLLAGNNNGKLTSFCLTLSKTRAIVSDATDIGSCLVETASPLRGGPYGPSCSRRIRQDACVCSKHPSLTRGATLV